MQFKQSQIYWIVINDPNVNCNIGLQYCRV